MEQLIKSKKRVQKHGEVFTPQWMIDLMLGIPEIKKACETVDATFLEPAAGDGNFLVAILSRKLDAVIRNYSNKYWKTKSLFAVASIYGIELLEDNLLVARNRMFLYYLDWYEKHFNERLKSNTAVYKSVRFLIHNNIVRGNTLSKTHPETDKPIVFSEWEKVSGHPSKIKRKLFYFSDLFNQELQHDSVFRQGQLNLFDFIESDENQDVERIIDIQKVYMLGE